MNTTVEERKNKAIEYLKELDIFKPYINGFEKNNDTCFYENYGGFWTFQDKELLAKQKELEEKYNCTVFAITHEYTEFGECYSFLLVSDYKEEWEYTLEKVDYNKFYAFAYVWNKSDDYCSEFGTIGIKSKYGGIRRFA